MDQHVKLLLRIDESEQWIGSRNDWSAEGKMCQKLKEFISIQSRESSMSRNTNKWNNGSINENDGFLLKVFHDRDNGFLFTNSSI